MANENSGAADINVQIERIDVNSEASVSEWATKLDSTDSQVRDAVAEVGDRATDVEMYLKGSRSTTNIDRVKDTE